MSHNKSMLTGSTQRIGIGENDSSCWVTDDIVTSIVDLVGNGGTSNVEQLKKYLLNHPALTGQLFEEALKKMGDDDIWDLE